MRNDLDVLAEMLGANSTAALALDDGPVAAEILSTLRAKRHIVAADIFTAEGRLPGQLRRASGPAEATPAMRADGAWFQAGRLILFKTIGLDGVKIGAILSRIGPGGTRRAHPALRLDRFSHPAGAGLLAFALASRLQGIILEPIAHLGRAAKIVSEQKIYSTRAVKVADDDMGQLTDVFTECCRRSSAATRICCVIRIVWSARWRRGRPNWSHRTRTCGWQKTRPRPPAAPRASFWPT